MLNIGRKIYYEKSNGIVIWDKGDMSGDVVETTFEQDCEVMPIISTLGEQLGILQLAYQQHKIEFQNCKNIKIDTVNQEVIFIA